MIKNHSCPLLTHESYTFPSNSRPHRVNHSQCTAPSHRLAPSHPCRHAPVFTRAVGTCVLISTTTQGIRLEPESTGLASPPPTPSFFLATLNSSDWPSPTFATHGISAAAPPRPCGWLAQAIGSSTQGKLLLSCQFSASVNF
ncbi:hypothetical protein BKA81DRAFT_347368 [Phyllosticta paracitricarpa]